MSDVQGPVWPMLFVLVACGAVSGFHSLVVGGTTSKQLTNETQGKAIAYGGMLTEGVVAVVTVLMVGGGLYWIAPEGGGIDMARLGFRETLQSGGWIMAFGNGYGNVVHQMLPDRKSTRLNSSHKPISYAVFCLKKKNINKILLHHHYCSSYP